MCFDPVRHLETTHLPRNARPTTLRPVPTLGMSVGRAVTRRFTSSPNRKDSLNLGFCGCFCLIYSGFAMVLQVFVGFFLVIFYVWTSLKGLQRGFMFQFFLGFLRQSKRTKVKRVRSLVWGGEKLFL